MVVTVPSASLVGVHGHPVRVEVHITSGLPGYTVVGAPDSVCRESRDRVRAAMLTNGFPWPRQRITVNLAPSTLPKAGASLDLAAAVGLLAADGQLDPESLRSMAFIGELGLDGTIRSTKGTLPLVEATDASSTTVVALSALAEARLSGHPDLRGAPGLAELVACLRGEAPWATGPRSKQAPAWTSADAHARLPRDPRLRLAVEVAAAGGHHLLLVGPASADTTSLVHAVSALRPPLDAREAMETTRVHSAAGLPLSEDGLVRRPPLRVPHRAASTVALIGGSTSGLAPGELSLAHNGILLLEGITDFSPDILDSVRHALDRGTVRLTRGSTTTELPARFQLIATMSPCPCGLGHGGCTCTGSERVRHLRSVPGPLMSRFDIRLPLAASGGAWPERSDIWAAAASRVTEARDRRREAAAGSADAPMSARASELLQRWVREGRLSGRGESQLCAVAQTLADLSGRGAVDSDTVSRALDLHGDPHQLFKPPGNRDVDSESVRRTPLPTTADGRGGGGSERSRARLDAYARRADSGAGARPYGTEPPPASNGLA